MKFNMKEIYLSISAVEKENKGFRLGPVSSDFYSGEIYYILGTNGSGKTTLLNLLGGLTHANTGEILYFGKEMHNNEKEIKNRIGFIPNYVILPPSASPKFLGKLYKTMFDKFSKEKYYFYLKKFDLNMKQMMRTFSDGEKKKVLIALCLAYFPDILIIDELQNDLDAGSLKFILDEIENMCQKQGMTVIISAHEADEIIINNYREIILEKGTIRSS